MADDESGGKEQPIIIKKIYKAGGHHGGAWKVAYADFVTAMMAFFLLLWLLNVTTEEQKNAISNYFDPSHPAVSESTSGAGGVMGGLSVAVEGSMATTVQPMNQIDSGKAQLDDGALDQAKKELEAQEQAEFQKAKEAIENAIKDNPELADLAENLLIDMTPEGLRIQVVDAEGKPMFPSGSARMYEKTKKLMDQVGKAINALPNEISVRGHTDSIPYGSGGDYTNWELSTDRANASRRVLQETGIKAERLNNVVGKADTEHLLPKDPTNARNRRISILLLREEITDPEAFKERAEKLAKQKEIEAAKKAAENPPPPPATGSLPQSMSPAPQGDGSGTQGSQGNVAPAMPTPKSGSFERTDGDVTFP